MAQQIKRFGKWLVVLVPLALIAVLLAHQRSASATTYTSPWWTNGSSSPECVCDACGCESPAEFLESVSVRTGEPVIDFELFRTPGRTEDNVFSLRWRGSITDVNEVGRGMLFSMQHTVREIDLGGGDVEVEWRRPDGLMVVFDHDAGVYTTTACNVHHVLTKNGAGRYVLTDKLGNQMLFDANGMPDKYTDRNGAEDDFTYDSSYQWTGYTDDRGKSYTIHHDANGFIDYIDDYASNRWSLGYDTGGNLTTITTPATADQPSGSTTTITYDGSDRITAIQDGRGNTTREFTYVGSTRQIDALEIDDDVVDFAWNSGRTDVTDRRGYVHRYHFSGTTITQTDLWISSQAKYVTEYRWNGNDLLTIVYPRENRVDFTWDGNDNLTERRQKTTDTSATSGTDIVETWGYTNSFLTSYTDPLGNQWAYTRDTDGNVTGITYPTVTSPTLQTASKLLTVNTYGQVTQVTDAEGKVTDYTYHVSGNGVGLLESIQVDPTGLALTTAYDYDSAGNVASVTDPRSKTTTYTWDALRRLKEVTAPSPLSHKVKHEYDANGNRTKTEVENRDKDGNQVTANPWFTTTYTYTALDLVASMTEEIDVSDTRTTSVTYDEEGRQTQVTKPEGNLEDRTYNERGLLATVVRGATAPGASTRELFYDDNGNLTEDEDGRNNDTTHTYDLFDRRTKTTNALGHYTQWTLDKAGQVTEVARKDSANNTLLRRTSYYDQRRRLWKTGDLRKDPGLTYADAETVITRYKTGHVSTVLNARSKTTTYGYDNAWRRTSETDALGDVKTWTLDAAGNATEWTIKDENGASDETFTYQATYDAVNRRDSLVEVDRTNGSNTLTTTYGHDSRGNLVWQVNALGNPTRYTFDGLSRLRKKEVALAFTGETFTSALETQWGFDENDRLTSHKDDSQNTTTWIYDALDRATTMTYANATLVGYTYDANDNVTQTIDAAGNDIDDTYDALNRRTARSVVRATGFMDTTLEAFGYDAADRLTSAEDDDYKVEYTHAVLGLESQPYEEKQSYTTGTAYLKTVTRTWDAVGNKATEAYPSGLSLTYTWTDVDQLDTITDGTNTLADYDYLGLRRSKTTYGNGAWTDLSYTGFRSEVATIHHKKDAGTTALRLDYGYNGLHDRTYERYGTSGASGDAFEYDKARRLTLGWMGSSLPSSPSGSAYVKQIQYNLDDDGNRTSVVTTPYGQSAQTTSYTDNNLNQYTTVGGTSRGHDGNGNVTDDGTYLYQYNYKNLLCRVKLKSNNSVVATYRYDALGRRVEKAVTGATYRYILSGEETVSVYTSTGTWKQDYVYDDRIDGIVMLAQADVLDADGDSNTSETMRHWYLRNALGSVMGLLEPDRDEAVSYRYDPYGGITITRGGSTYVADPLGQPITYTGRWRDEETGLCHYRARTYDPARGRFLQRDPLGVAAGPNLYEYCESSPLNKTDPTGLHAEGDPNFRGPVPGESEADAKARRQREDEAWIAKENLRYKRCLEEKLRKLKLHLYDLQTALHDAEAELELLLSSGSDPENTGAEREDSADRSLELQKRIERMRAEIEATKAAIQTAEADLARLK